MLFLSEQPKEPVDSWSGMAVDFSPSFSTVSRARKGFAWIASAQSNEGKAEIIKSEENIDYSAHARISAARPTPINPPASIACKPPIVAGSSRLISLASLNFSSQISTETTVFAAV